MNIKERHISQEVHIYTGHTVAQVVEVLRYKPEDRGFDSL